MENFNKKLEELKGNSANPFSVPEGYFENFPTRMQEKISSKEQEPAWIMKLMQYVKPQFALGFMIVAFAFISIITVDFILSNKNSSGLNNELYTRIIEVDASEFTERHVLDVLLEEDKKTVEKKKIESDYYINYLIDEDIDYGTLIDEL
jgi:hypothetical protein